MPSSTTTNGTTQHASNGVDGAACEAADGAEGTAKDIFPERFEFAQVAARFEVGWDGKSGGCEEGE